MSRLVADSTYAGLPGGGAPRPSPGGGTVDRELLRGGMAGEAGSAGAVDGRGMDRSILRDVHRKIKYSLLHRG